MAKIKRFPKTLYAKIENDGDLSYYVTSENAYELLEMGDTIKIGTYQLSEECTAEAIMKLSPAKKR